jgi:hypothetical protein
MSFGGGKERIVAASVEPATETQEVEVRFKITRNDLGEVERLRWYLGAPNLATAIYNSARLLNSLYHYQRQGFELKLVRGDDVRRFRLPEAAR